MDADAEPDHGAVGVVLLIGCANLANLMLARGANRRREVSVRSVLGATSGRLIRQFMVETAVMPARDPVPKSGREAWRDRK